MKVGILKEIKVQEHRVSLTPAGANTLKANGHSVFVENNAGLDSDFSNQNYIDEGATILQTAKEVFDTCDMVMHVKEPQPQEYDLIRKDQIVFTYLHLAAEKKLTDALIKSGASCIAYETIQKEDLSLPLLTPMSEVAGRMAIQEGAKYLERTYGGYGCLLGGVTGVEPATVVVIGGGVVGTNAAQMACGLGAKVYILDMNLSRLRYLSEFMPANCFPIKSDPVVLKDLLKRAHMVVGAVLIPGASAPKLISKPMLKTMKLGAVLVDVAIDQGGCFETSRVTTHEKPTYIEDGIVHYCVGNMPGAVPITSTRALTNATMPYAVQIANMGVAAAKQNNEIKLGVNVMEGKITYKPVAEAFGYGYTPVDDILNSL